MTTSPTCDLRHNPNMTEQRERTSEKLARELEARGLNELAARARRFDYDEYKSEVTATPLMLLVDHLLGYAQEAGDPHRHDDFLRRVADGDFDAQEWEADEWAASEEGQQTFRDLMGSITKDVSEQSGSAFFKDKP